MTAAPTLAAVDVDELSGTPYRAYVYAYPHKTAYRPLDPPVRLADAWRDERKDALFLYLHVPFCEMRCGFCNLFTTSTPKDDVVDRYLDAVALQADAFREALGGAARFARFALGGGTPTLLDPARLDRALSLVEAFAGARLSSIPGSVETSPETATPDRLKVLRGYGVSRVSIGVQSFFDEESRAVLRPQARATVEAALSAIRDAGFPVLNVDLMYGLPGQTDATWKASLRAALAHRPEELYLYPLYVRPLTGLGKTQRSWDDERLALYRAGRELLLDEGYVQVSMRMFRARHAPVEDGPAYCVQDDGMVGLGCGARSYTRALHHGTDYAVGVRGVREILDAWMLRSRAGFELADRGFVLDGDEQRRRYVAVTLLAEGTPLAAYGERFGSGLFDDLPQLQALSSRGWAEVRDGVFRLLPAGLERSDAVGPWLASPAVRARMEGFALR